MKKYIFLLLLFLVSILSISCNDKIRRGKIYNAEQFLSLQNQDLDGDYILMNDIDLNGKEISPIISNRGTFDGNYHTISNFTISGKEYFIDEHYFDEGTDLCALFLSNFGVIKNLEIKNFNINVSCEKETAIGSLVGYNNFGADIINTRADGSINCTDNSDDSVFVGGITGVNFNSIVSQTYSNVDINVSGNIDGCYIGGIIGYSISGGTQWEIVKKTSELSYSYSTSNISINGNTDVNGYVKTGGLIGGVFSADLLECYSFSTIEASLKQQTAYAGGLTGSNYNLDARSCLSLTNINASSNKNVVLYSLFASRDGAYNVFNSYWYENIKLKALVNNEEVIENIKFSEDLCTDEDLLNKEFYSNYNLLSFDEEIWDLENIDHNNKIYPTLKFVLVQN